MKLFPPASGHLRCWTALRCHASSTNTSCCCARSTSSKRRNSWWPETEHTNYVGNKTQPHFRFAKAQGCFLDVISVIWVMKIVFTNSLLHWDHHDNRRKHTWKQNDTIAHGVDKPIHVIRSKIDGKLCMGLGLDAAIFTQWCTLKPAMGDNSEARTSWGDAWAEGRTVGDEFGRVGDTDWVQHLALKWGWILTKSVWLQMSAKKEGNRALVLPSLDFLWLPLWKRGNTSGGEHAVWMARCVALLASQGWLRTSLNISINYNSDHYGFKTFGRYTLKKKNVFWSFKNNNQLWPLFRPLSFAKSGFLGKFFLGHTSNNS